MRLYFSLNMYCVCVE